MLGSALEAAGKWPKAEGVYMLLKTLTSRLLGKGHKAAKAAAVRAKRAGRGQRCSRSRARLDPKWPKSGK